MSVVNGQIANQTTFNTAFLSRTAPNTSTVAILALQNSQSQSGASVDNVQQALNETFDAVGMSGTNDATRKNYASQTVITNGDSHKTALGKIDAKFNGTTGHAHTGAAGDGALISANTLANFNKYFTVLQSITVSSIAGTTKVVTSLMSGKVAGGSTSSAGVITSSPDNRNLILDATILDYIEDTSGRRVYGRLTYAAGVWTLNFFVNISGTETAYNLTASSIKVVFREVFDAENRPTLGESVLDLPSFFATQDIVDATASLRGLVNTGSQIFGGAKTFNGDLATLGRLIGDDVTDSTTTGTNAAMPAPAKAVVKLSNSSLASVATITGSTTKQFFLILNKTGATITLKNSNVTNGIFTFSGFDMSLPNNAAALMWFDVSSSRYVVIGGGGAGGGNPFQETPSGTINGVNQTFTLSQAPDSAAGLSVFIAGVHQPPNQWSVSGTTLTFGSGFQPATAQSLVVVYNATTAPAPTPTPTLVPQGTVAAPLNIGTSGITPTSNARQVAFLKSTGGHVTVTANPQIAAGSAIGNELVLIGQDDTDYITLNDGNGLYLNGAVDLKAKSSIWLIWDGALWNEISRR